MPRRDGVAWSPVTPAAPWSAREDHAAVVHDGKIWILGGTNNADVWSSPDGLNWTPETAVASWIVRGGHTCVMRDGQFWLFGGYYNAGEDYTFLNDGWTSSDGIGWLRTLGPAPWAGRAGHALAALNGQIWILGGTQGGTANMNDVWRSSNGTDWIPVTFSASWSARNGHAAVEHGGDVWLIGGKDSSPRKER